MYRYLLNALSKVFLVITNNNRYRLEAPRRPTSDKFSRETVVGIVLNFKTPWETTHTNKIDIQSHIWFSLPEGVCGAE